MSPRPEEVEEKEEEEEGEGEERKTKKNIASHGEPAANTVELTSRVKRTLTRVLRKKQRENPYPVALMSLTGSIDGYSKTQTEIKAAPLELGPVTQKVIVEFDEVQDKSLTKNDLGDLVTRRQEFQVTVSGEELPIYVAEQEVDMRCTLFGRTYRKRFELRNRAAITYKVTINIRPPFDKFIEVSPAMCFIQSYQGQWINTKFTPKSEMLTDLRHYCVYNEMFAGSAYCELPIEIEVTGQELPVYFVLKSEVTPSTIDLSVKSLDFGAVYVNQQSTISFTATNTSMLPQRLPSCT